MMWLFILTIGVLGFLVAFETACLLALRGEYVAVSGMLREANKRMMEFGLASTRPLERQFGLVEQTSPNYEGDDLY